MLQGFFILECIMLANILIGIFIGFATRGLYNKYYLSKIETTMFKEIEYSCLQLLILTYEDFEFLKEKKRIMMSEMNIPEREIRLTSNMDDARISSWKERAINKFILAVPVRFRSSIEYRSWRMAMAYLNKFKKGLDTGKK